MNLSFVFNLNLEKIEMYYLEIRIFNRLIFTQKHNVKNELCLVLDELLKQHRSSLFSATLRAKMKKYKRENPKRNIRKSILIKIK